MPIEKYSLRETKSVRIKVSLMQAFMDMLKKKRFDEISIKEVCRQVEISEPTFFKYFPEKTDIVGYYLQLLTRRAIGHAYHQSPKGKVIPSINRIFSFMAAELQTANAVVYQVLSLMLSEEEKLKKVAVSSLDMKLAFGSTHDENEEFSPIHMDEFFLQEVKRAIQQGELPSRTKVRDVEISLMSILIGTLFAVRFTDMANCARHYDRQLALLWKSLGASL